MIWAFDIVEWTLVGLLGVLFIAQVYWYSRYLAAPARKIRKGTKDKVQSTKEDASGVTSIHPFWA